MASIKRQNADTSAMAYILTSINPSHTTLEDLFKAPVGYKDWRSSAPTTSGNAATVLHTTNPGTNCPTDSDIDPSTNADDGYDE